MMGVRTEPQCGNVRLPSGLREALMCAKAFVFAVEELVGEVDIH